MTGFTTCDRYFSDVVWNSFPNHAFSIGADAEGSLSNPGHTQGTVHPDPGVPARLQAAGKTWGNYGGGFAFRYYVDPLMHGNVFPHGQFQQDAQAGSLPDVSWVYGPAHQTSTPAPSTPGTDPAWRRRTPGWEPPSVRSPTASSQTGDPCGTTWSC